MASALITITVDKTSLHYDRETISTHVDTIITAIEEGHLNPLDAFVHLKYINTLTEAARKKITAQAVAEAEKHGKTFDHEGAEITVKGAAGKWDYSDIPEIEQLEEDLKALKYLHRQAAGNKDGNNTVTRGGEIVEPAIYTPGGQTLSVKFK